MAIQIRFLQFHQSKTCPVDWPLVVEVGRIKPEQRQWQPDPVQQLEAVLESDIVLGARFFDGVGPWLEEMEILLFVVQQTSEHAAGQLHKFASLFATQCQTEIHKLDP
ncbi:hypothetical protein D3C84_547690 [compost metagenome]